MSTKESPETANDPAAPRPPLALIAGPTASGKSDLAVRLARAIEQAGRRAAVINADSAQVYADLCVLSARPTPEEMGGIEHRLFGAWDGATACSAADWATRARDEIAALHAEGAVPVLVGGTGLYIRALLDGIAPVPEIAPEVRQAVRALDTADAHKALLAEDPARAAALNPNDATRIARALEVVRSTGRTLGEWQERREGGIGHAVSLHPLILLPDRDWLYARCDRRFALMLQQGAVGEVETLLARDLDPAMPVMRAIGVPEIAGYLRGQWSLDEAGIRAATATRQYAKRQYTWFRHQPPPGWPRLDSASASIDDALNTLIGAILLP